MIQELLGGAGLIAGERKIAINGGVLGATPPSLSPSPSHSSSSSTTSTTTATTSSTTTTSSNPENLRCPRCDSSNTKFCYYNNYNLTQPRHFCKTCRRYWTKGGALRNVPIGGGCRKNKNATVSASVVAAAKTSAGKMKMVANEFGRSGFGGGFDHELSSSPILWGSPQNSHLLALLRSPSTTQNPNPNSLCNSMSAKDESGMIGSHLVNESIIANGGLNGRSLGLDPLSQQVTSLGLCSSFWRNNNQNQQPPHQQNGFILGEVQNSGIQELYQRLRSSSANYYTDHSAVVLTNVASSSSTSSTTASILESAPVGGGELGYWNPTFSWSDLPTSTNGAYP